MFLTEDEVRDNAKITLGLNKKENNVQQGTGQLTTFNQLGFKGINDKPDGWYIPSNKEKPALLLEAKNSNEDVRNPKWISEINKNINILKDNGYKKVIGIIHNGHETIAFTFEGEINVPNELQDKSYYLDMFKLEKIDKKEIYKITKRINESLNKDFAIKMLEQRMVFTACALVARKEGAFLYPGMDYENFHSSIQTTLNKVLYKYRNDNINYKHLIDVFCETKMNLNTNPEEELDAKKVKEYVQEFIKNIDELASYLDSKEWNGEDVMSIFFNEFNRYKAKSEKGQVFTPDHIANLMYRLLNCTKDDYILDAACGSGTFLTVSMANMIKEAGGIGTQKAQEIMNNQIYGIEFDRMIYALTCSNMLIHKAYQTNIVQMDSRYETASKWIRKYPITKVLMNPPFEKKYGCLKIVLNVLDSVKKGTDCAFIMPDKKLEKDSQSLVNKILKKHRLIKIIKLPKNTFFNASSEASIFIFKAGEPQNNAEIFGCYIEEDGLETVKNQGRHDVKGKWQAIEDYWVDSISKLRDDKYGTAQWLKPSEHLSYQMSEEPFEISEEDFKKTAMDYLSFKRGINTKEFGKKLLNATLYGSEVTSDDTGVNIKIGGDKDD